MCSDAVLIPQVALHVVAGDVFTVSPGTHSDQNSNKEARHGTRFTIKGKINMPKLRIERKTSGRQGTATIQSVKMKPISLDLEIADTGLYKRVIYYTSPRNLAAGPRSTRGWVVYSASVLQ